MPFVFNSVSIAVLATNHNPGILSHSFLRSNNIVAFDSPKNFVHTPVFSMLQYENSIMLKVDEQRLDFSDVTSNVEATPIIDIARKYIETLPYTPFKALGLNFIGTIIIKDESDLNSFLSVFFKPKAEVMNRIGIENINLGVKLIYYVDIAKCTLNLDPVSDSLNLQVSYNYHIDRGDSKVLANTLLHYSEILRHFNEKISNLLREE